MEKQQALITVGIPAYNEEANISALLKCVLSQEISDGAIVQIILILDGCTDATAARASGVIDPRIETVEFVSRRGLPESQNEIVRRTRGDILVLLNADVLLSDNQCINNLIRPLLNNERVGLTSARVVPQPPQGLVERSIVFSHLMKTKLFERAAPQSVYLCHGRARALSRKVFSSIRWPIEYSEDAYSYFYTRSQGYDFQYVSSALVLFRSPQTVADHVRQSSRFLTGRSGMERLFGKKTVRLTYRIPLLYAMAVIVEALIAHPLLVLGYCGLTACARVFYTVRPVVKNRALFDPSPTSKKVIV